jgi:hypothetical protein
MGAGATAEADRPTPPSASRDARQLEEYRKLRHGEQLADARTSAAGWAPSIVAEAFSATASTLPLEGSLRPSEAASTTRPPTPEPASPAPQPGWQIAGKDEDGGANVDTQTVDESGDDDEERRARSELVQEMEVAEAVVVETEMASVVEVTAAAAAAAAAEEVTGVVAAVPGWAVAVERTAAMEAAAACTSSTGWRV